MKMGSSRMGDASSVLRGALKIVARINNRCSTQNRILPRRLPIPSSSSSSNSNLSSSSKSNSKSSSNSSSLLWSLKALSIASENAIKFGEAAIFSGNPSRKSPTSIESNEKIQKESESFVLRPEISSLQLVEQVNLLERDAVHRAAFRREVKVIEAESVEKEVIEEQDVQSNKAKMLENAPKKLSTRSRERSVPSSRVGRVASFGSLGLGLGLGTVAEASRRLVGLSDSSSSVLLSEANAQRLVNSLCRMRGAALKIGQMISIQDEAILSPQLASIFDRVRQSADFMPQWQMESVMSDEFGSDWRARLFSSFDSRPFAAASIGQVHSATLNDDLAKHLQNRRVAVKIQYPGVAKGIDSDVNNLLTLLNMAKVLPQGLFLESVVQHLKVELRQECDYEREAECCRRMRNVLQPFENDLVVPEVVDEACTKHVFTAEMIEGLTIDECVHLSQAERDRITLLILRLLLRELFVFNYMQTDPNWANFLYNPESQKLGLLDFGATREYRDFFVSNYFHIIDGAARGDRDQVLDYSRRVGFLTGAESRVMNEAHVDSVLILGQCFREPRVFDFGEQRVTQRMQELIPVMLKNRLCPPPPEIYSLHRKMSGLFLLAAKLGAKIDCSKEWSSIREEFEAKQRYRAEKET